jgi:hypothetical protein
VERGQVFSKQIKGDKMETEQEWCDRKSAEWEEEDLRKFQRRTEELGLYKAPINITYVTGKISIELKSELFELLENEL